MDDEALPKVCEALYLLARFYPPVLSSCLRGRLWERLAARALSAAGVWIRQGPGALTLFGSRSASGLRHELDGGGACHSWTAVLEAKAYGDRGPSKVDVCLFDRKTFDLYVARRRAGEKGPHFRIMASTQPFDPALLKYCYLYGIVAVDPRLFPLPMLVRMASRPMASSYFQDGILAELVRLGEPACGPLERRYVPDGPHHLRLDVRLFPERDLSDLLWVHQTITADLLDIVDLEAPGYYEQHAEELADALGIFSTAQVNCYPSVHSD
jgi:hypothetical protein